MSGIEGGPVEPGELEKKLNKLVARTIVDDNFSKKLNSPKERKDAMMSMSFTEDEIENLGPGFEKVSISRLIQKGLAIEDIISKLTEKDSNSE